MALNFVFGHLNMIFKKKNKIRRITGAGVIQL
jgi:hypothetical protein